MKQRRRSRTEQVHAAPGRRCIVNYRNRDRNRAAGATPHFLSGERKQLSGKWFGKTRHRCSSILLAGPCEMAATRPNFVCFRKVIRHPCAGEPALARPMRLLLRARRNVLFPKLQQTQRDARKWLPSAVAACSRTSAARSSGRRACKFHPASSPWQPYSIALYRSAPDRREFVLAALKPAKPFSVGGLSCMDKNDAGTNRGIC